MSRAGNEAYNAAHKSAHEIVLDCIASIVDQIHAGEITTDEEIYDAIHEEADMAVTYTSDAWILAYGLNEADMDDLGGITTDGGMTGIITRQAYANVCQELQSAMTEFGDAMAVMADKRAEESEESASEESEGA